MRILGMLFLAVSVHAARAQHQATVALGHAVVALNGPWAFHTGDDPRWADPAFDDSAWESVDLSAPANAHDPDVGLTGYVRGWTSRRHAGYSGYAWYRLHVLVSTADRDSLAMMGPSAVEDAYQLFVNGALRGGSGRFAGQTPVVYGAQPRLFALGTTPPRNGGDSATVVPLVFAVRVWVSASTIAGSPADAGGIHIAPAIGEASAVRARYKLQWLEIFNGYVVEVALPVSFLVLAIMACAIYYADRRDPAYLWLSAALLATGLLRANQAFYFWTQYESRDMFAVVKAVILTPAALGVWMMTWYSWFRPTAPSLLPRAIASLTVLFAISQALAIPYWTPIAASVSAASQTVSIGLHLCFLAVLLAIVYQGIVRRGLDSFVLLAVASMAVGLFAYELGVLHVPGIWFPFGVGVSRAQFAYAAMDVALFVVLFRRHLATVRPPAPA